MLQLRRLRMPVERVANRRNLWQRLHRVRDHRPICGDCDAFADLRRRSGGSLTHHVAQAPQRSCPTCRQYPRLRGTLPRARAQRYHVHRRLLCVCDVLCMFLRMRACMRPHHEGAIRTDGQSRWVPRAVLKGVLRVLTRVLRVPT
jgi:hypothetical protein